VSDRFVDALNGALSIRPRFPSPELAAAVVVAGAVATLALIGTAYAIGVSHDGVAGRASVLLWAPPAAYILAMATALAVRSVAPWPVRLAIATAGSHLAVLVGLFLLWRAHRETGLAPQYLPAVQAFVRPLAAVVAGVVLALAGLASVGRTPRARRRAVRLVAGTLAAFLAALLFFGLAARLAATMWPLPIGWSGEIGALGGAPLIALVALAAAATALALALGHRLCRLRCWGTLAAPLAAPLAINAVPDHQLVYANFLPFVIALGALSVAGIAALGIAQWRALTPAAGPLLRGVVAASAPPSRARLRGWAEGFVAEQRAFVLRTATQPRAIPDGAPLVARLPASSIRLHTGDELAIASPGDEVMVAGLPGAAGAPFRSLGGALGRVTVVPVHGSRVSTLALQLYRPCVVYLAIFCAVFLAGVTALGD
jgi:hypothetical protein